jgi:hypothetical protein
VASIVRTDDRLSFDLRSGLLCTDFTVRCRRCGAEARAFLHPLMRRRSRDARIATTLRVAGEHACAGAIPTGYSGAFDGKGLLEVPSASNNWLFG